MRIRRRFGARGPAVVIAVGVLVVAACGDDDGPDTSDSTDSPEQTDEVTEEVLFEDSFDSNEHGWLPSEVAGPDEGGTFDVPRSPGFTVTLEDGALTFASDGRSDFGVYLQWPAELTSEMDTASDIRVEAEVRAVAPGTPILACRVNGNTESVRSYQFHLSSAGAYQINETDGDGSATVLATEPSEIADQLEDDDPGVPDFEPAFDFEDDRTYEMAAECTGGQDGEPVQLVLFVDGEEVLSVDDDEDPIPTGIAGIRPGVSSVAQSESTGDGYSVSYDSLRIVDLST